MATQGRRVHSIEKAIALLDCFWSVRRPLALSELVQMTGWAKSTIHGMLATMVDSAVIEQNPADGKYQLGYHLFELGGAVNACWDVVALARPQLLHIAATHNASAYLARLSGDELLLVECMEPHEGFRVSSDPGTRMPPHCTSQGKAILANRPEAEVRQLLRHRGMPALTPDTITEWPVLQRQLEKARAEGVAVERGEYKPGLQSVAAPIFSGRGECSYAIGIVDVMRAGQWPDYERLAQAAKQAAEAVSRELGWTK